MKRNGVCVCVSAYLCVVGFAAWHQGQQLKVRCEHREYLKHPINILETLENIFGVNLDYFNDN